MSRDDFGAGHQELAQASFGIPLVDGDAFMLAQVISPGVDQINFHQTLGYGWVAKQVPVVSAASLAAPSKVPRGFDESGLVFAGDSIVGADHNGPIFGGRFADEHRLRPMKRRS